MTACPACGSVRTTEILRTEPMPVNSCSLLFSVDESLAYPQRAMALRACPTCGFFWNADFDAAAVAYDAGYEATQIFSQHFRAYLQKLAQRWLDRLDVAPASVLEVGCGQGEFLETLSRITDAELVGYDPAYRGKASEGIFIHATTLPHRAARRFDLVVNRMTLEHVPNPAGFLAAMASWVAPEGVLITQVPNAARTLDKGLACDLFYEHVNYFTAPSLERALRAAGFSSNAFETDYAGQHLTAISSRGPDGGALKRPPRNLDRLVRSFGGFADAWGTSLAQRSAAGRSVWIWGTGSRATTFMGLLPDPGVVEGAIDINPARAGSFIAGSTCRTHLPNVLEGRRDLSIVVMNPVYVDEIVVALRELSAEAEILPLAGMGG